MKKNTVITIVIAVLLCLVLLGAANAPRRIVSPVASKYMNDPQSVTFIDENSKTTVFIEKGGKFASLPDLPNDDDPNHVWNWIIDATGEVLSTQTPIENAMTVHAVMTDNTPVNDYYDGMSGVLVTRSADANSTKLEAAILATSITDSTGLDVCFEGDDCTSAPLVWTFSRVADKPCVTDTNRSAEAQCFYTVHSSAGYMNISGSAISISGTAQPIRIAKRDIGFSLMDESGNYGLSLKDNGAGNRCWFKPTDNNQYYKNRSVKFSFDSADKFVSQLYTVTFNTQGGSLAAPQPLKVNSGGTITLPVYNGTLSKHAFAGWADAAGNQYPAGQPYTVTANTTLYAVYDNTTLYIWLDGNGGTFGGAAFFEISNEQSVNVTLPEAEGRDGYKFIGWKDQHGNLYAAGKEIDFSSVNSDLTLQAVWHKVSGITFVTAQDGQKPPILIDIDVCPFVYLDRDNTYQVERNGDPVTSDIGFYPPMGISKWMYFDDGGYKLEIDVSEDPVFEVPSYDVTFFEVKDSDQEITVRFDPNGGEIEGSTGSHEYKAINGEEIVLSLLSVSRENYDIIGWEDAFGYFYPATGLFPCRIDETLKAVWGYTVNFDARGGNGGSPSVNCILGQECTFPEYSGTRNGNAFLGWIMSETYNKNDIYYQKTDLLEENDEARAFRYYALYESTITFDTNGGGNLFDPAGNTVSKTLKNKQPWVDVIDLSQFTPVKNVEETSDSGNINNQIGKREFLGWAVSKNAGKDQIINAYEVTGALDQTLYAIWGSRFFYYMRGENGSEDIEIAPPSAPGLEGTPVTLTAAVDNLDAANFKGWTDGSKQYKLPDLGTKYRKTNTKLYALWDKDVQIVFNKNNQNNDVTGTAPASKSAKIGDEITIPGDNGLTKSGFNFLGWTDGSNLLDSSYHRIYKEGEKYVIPMTSGEKITFYAAWTPNGEADGVAKDQVRFGIRLDGTIPKEPGNYQASDYTSRKGIELGNVFYSANQVIERKWVADNDPDVSKLNTAEQGYGVAGYYIVNDVTKAVTMVPRAEDITFIMKNNGKNFDPSTQYVLWYVLKWQGKSGNDYIWHVDGVVLDKEKVTLVYDFNCDPVKKVNNMPRGFQVGKNTDIVVGDNGGINQHDSWMVPDRVDEAGIHFKGWSLFQDPVPGDKIYTAADPIEARTIKLTQPVTTLYAQWETSYVDVEFYKEWENDTDPLVQSLIPENIFLTLTGKRTEDDSVYKTQYYSVTPNGKDGNGKGWYLKVQNLPAFDTAGKALAWDWSEEVPHFRESGRTRVSSSDGSVTTITITNQLVTKSTVTKVWNDENDNDGKRPDSVTVQLYANGQAIPQKTAVLSEDNKWSHVEENLPVFDEDGRKITYTWDEIGVPAGFEWSSEADAPSGYTKKIVNNTDDPVTGYKTEITNTHELETVEKSGTKTWDDQDNKWEGRPESPVITVQLYADGEEVTGKTITVDGTIDDNEPEAYKWNFKDLQKYKNKHEIVYTIQEINVPAGYEPLYSGMNVTNKHYYITIDTKELSKVYDGEPLELADSDYEEVQGLRNGDTIHDLKFAVLIIDENGEPTTERLNTAPSQTIVGKYSNLVLINPVIKDKGDEDVTSLYTPVYKTGSLEVTKRTIYVKANDAEKTYGEADETADRKFTAGLDSRDGNTLGKGDTLSYVPVTRTNSSVQNVGEYPGVLEPQKDGITITRNNGSVDVTSCYDIKTINGTFTINPAIVTVKADDQEKIYGGEEPALTATITGLKYDDTESVIAYSLSRESGEIVKRYLSDLDDKGEFTRDPDPYVITAEAPKTHNTVTRDGVEYSIQGNYLVKYEPGYFVIKPAQIEIKGKIDSKEYDGTALTFESSELNKNGILDVNLLRGDQIQYVKVSGSRTVAGDIGNTPLINTSKNTNNIRIISSDGRDVTACYNITPTPGLLTIDKAPLTITAANATKVFDGTPLEKNAYTNTKLKGNDTIEFVQITGSVIGSRDRKTEQKNIASNARISHPQLGDVTASYDITYNPGMLIVSPRPSLVITADSDAKTYDGTPLTKNTYTATGLREGDTLSGISVEGSQTDAGTSENVVIGTALIINSNGDDVTGEYDITSSNGTLWVKPISIYLTASSAIKQVYDGTLLKDETFTYDPRKLVAGDSLDEKSVSVSGSRIQAGTSPNIISGGRIFNGGRDVTGNYNIIRVNGTLTINPRPVTVRVGAYFKSRGELDPEFTAAVTNTVNGETVEYVITREEGEDVGQYAVTPSGEKRQGSYLVTYIPGTLTINYNAEAFTVVKVWDDDNNRDGIRPVSLGVSLIGSNGTFVNRRLSAENGWTVTVTDMPVSENGVPVTYRWTEDLDTDSYEQLEPEVRSNTTILRNRHAIARTSSTVTKVWDDKDNRGGTRPASLRVVLRGNGRTVTGAVLNEANGWRETVGDLPMYENGRPVEYIWYEQSVGGGYYAVSSVTSGSTTTLVNSNLYKLTIHYRYNSGLEARPDYTDTLYSGETFSVISPEIANFTASIPSVVGQMETKDLEFTVVYTTGGEAIIRRDQNPGPEETVTEHKAVPTPRDTEPDADHPLVLPIPNILVEIDDLNTALGLGEVNSSNHGFALE